MAPHPNDTRGENNTNISESGIEEDANFVMIHENELDGQSSDENDIAETEYAGYKLLQQDVPNEVNDDDDDDDNSSSSSSDESVEGEVKEFHEDGPAQNIPQIDIDYQQLTCSGMNDDLPSTGLGFPEVIPECDQSEDNGIRDDNIEMNEDKVELVKNAMVGFSLPMTNIPEWAKNISEDKWKESLVSVNQKKDV